MAERSKAEIQLRLDSISDYLASIGKRGGEAGTGKAKRRTRKQYQEMAAKSAQVRRKKAKADRSI